MKKSKLFLVTSLGLTILLLALLFIIKFISIPNPITSPKRDMSDDTREVDMTIEFGDVYNENSSFFKGVSFEKPHDILLTSYGRILVSDSEANCLYEFDSSGAYLKTIGRTGNGGEEFNFPTALCEFDGNIAVVDNFNDRIQILSGKNYKYIDEIPLETSYTDSGVYYTSIVYDGEGAVYVSGNFMFSRDAYVTKIIIDAKHRFYKEKQQITPLCGTLYYDTDDDILYIAETYQHKSSQGSYKRMKGTHYLKAYNPKDGTLETVFEFPVKYMPSAVFKNDTGFIAVSLTRETVDRFDESGNYIDTIFQAGKFNGFHYAAMDYDGTMYLSCTFENNVLRLAEN